MYAQMGPSNSSVRAGLRSVGSARQRSLRVFLVAPIRAFGEGVARILADEPGIEVLGVAAPGAESARQIAAERPDVVVLDASTTDAAALARSLAAADVRCAMLAIGVPEDPGVVLSCAEARVGGYVSRDASARTLVESVRDISAGRFPCPPEISALLFRQVATAAAPPRDDPAASSCITNREREIVALIDRGFTNREIAAALFIELATVKNHVHNILEKLHVRRRAAAAAKMRRATAG